MVRPPSRGRQKIPMEKIGKKARLEVTFIKRRNGIFKKASELATLCGAELMILLFSPQNKLFSFGHPNVQYVIDRFRNAGEAPQAEQANMVMNNDNQTAKIHALNAQLAKIEASIEEEKKIGQVLRGNVDGNPIAMALGDQLTIEQKMELSAKLKDLQLRLTSAIQHKTANEGNYNFPFGVQNGLVFNNFGDIYGSSNNPAGFNNFGDILGLSNNSGFINFGDIPGPSNNNPRF